MTLAPRHACQLQARLLNGRAMRGRSALCAIVGLAVLADVWAPRAAAQTVMPNHLLRPLSLSPPPARDALCALADVLSRPRQARTLVDELAALSWEVGCSAIPPASLPTVPCPRALSADIVPTDWHDRDGLVRSRRACRW